MYNANDNKLMISSIGNGTNYGYILFNFEKEITRMDIDLGICEDSSTDLIKGNYRIRIYEIDENNNQNYISSLVENIENSKCKELSTGNNNLITVSSSFNIPIKKLLLKFEYLGNSPSSLGKFIIGNIYFYNFEELCENNPLPLSGYELPYDSDFWNETVTCVDSSGNDRYISDDTNCYAYILNTINYGNIVPGEYSDQTLSDNIYGEDYVEEILCKIKLDQLELGFVLLPVSKYETCPIGMYKVALVADTLYPQPDFHWYRQDDDGKWSHKPGNGKVIRLDGNNNEILDPEFCDKTNENNNNLVYNRFIGFYAVFPLN